MVAHQGSPTISGPFSTRVRGGFVDLLAADGGLLATFTVGARTVTMAGLGRRFSEPTAAHAVQHDVWVRLLPVPFTGVVDPDWLDAGLAANAAQLPDVLAVAMQYLHGQSPVHEGELQIAGSASYGPLDGNGRREEGSDFNDYLGVTWTYPDGTRDRAESRQFRCLDCSGYMRMVWGYRRHVPSGGSIALSRDPSPDQSTLPRRANEQKLAGPGVITVDEDMAKARDLSRLGVGDLVFFDTDAMDGIHIDHVGLYLGRDSGGHLRFLSSRKTHNGPTLGDVGSPSILDGDKLYARSFRAARRL